MKSAVDSNKEGRKSLSSNSEDTKRNKFEKAKQQSPKIKGNKDVFCWTCHRGGNVATCSRCPRAYHLKCGHLEKIPEPSEKWICPECDVVQRANSLTNNSQLKVLSQMLGYVIKRMKLVKGSEGFCEPVDTSKWHDYLDYVVKPMDIRMLEDNVRRHVYKSTEAFLADFRWLVHDSYVYNSVHSAYTKIAKSMSAVAKQECEEIKNCADCYLHAYSLGDEWFIEPCTTPHVLVWAQLSGFPYWPGKVMRQVSGDLIDVRFFGDHSRANVPVTSCFLYSRLMPCAVKKNHPKIADGIEEAEEHVKRLKILYGTFYYAQYRVRYVPRDEEVIRKLQLPGLRRPNETPEFLKQVELERAEKMILDKDFQSEMKQMYTQKKALIPAKRKSIDQSPKDGTKRMLVQLNTPMGPKCAIMNWSGSESDSSPKHVSERLVENTKSSLLNSSMGHQLNPAPSKRMRLSDKIENLAKRTPKKPTELKNNEAMVKQVVATSPKELADIYKSISPSKPKTPIKDSGIIESISRKLLSPTSLRSVGAEINQTNEGAPSVRTFAVKRLSDNPKLNGFEKQFKGFSTECDDDSDGDSDALFIASGESSPARNTDAASSINLDSTCMISAESMSQAFDCNSSAEKIEKSDSKNSQKLVEKSEKTESEDVLFVGVSSVVRAEETSGYQIDVDSSAKKVEENGKSKNHIIGKDSSVEKNEEISPSQVIGLDSSAEEIEENGKSKNRAIDSDPSAEMAGEESRPKNSSAEKVEELSGSQVQASAEKPEEKSQPGKRSSEKVVEMGGSLVQVLEGDASAEKVEEKVRLENPSAEKVEEKCRLENSAEKVEEISGSQGCVSDVDSSAEKIEEKSGFDNSSAGKVEEISGTQVCVSDVDSSAENVKDMSPYETSSAGKVEEKGERGVSEYVVSDKPSADGELVSNGSECRETPCAVAAPNNKEKNEGLSGNKVSVIESGLSKANDGGTSVLDLLNGDLTHLYDDLESQWSSASDERVVNETVNTASETDQLKESRSELSVVSTSCFGSISPSLKRDQLGLDSPGDISNDNKSRPSVISSSYVHSSPKKDQIRNEPSSGNDKSYEKSPEDATAIGIDLYKESCKKGIEVVEKTETVVAPKGKCPSKEKVSPSSVEGISDLPSSQTKEHEVEIPLVDSAASKFAHQVCETTSEVTSPTNISPLSETKEPSKLVDSYNESGMSVANSCGAAEVGSDGSTNEGPTPMCPDPNAAEENVDILVESSPLSEKCLRVQNSEPKTPRKSLNKSFELGVSVDTSEGPDGSSSPKKGDGGLLAPLCSILEVTSNNVEPHDRVQPESPKNNGGIIPSKSDQLPKSIVDSIDISDGSKIKDLPLKASNSANLLETTVEPVAEKVFATSVVQKPVTTLVFTYSSASNEKSAGREDKSVNRRSSLPGEAGRSVDKATEKVSPSLCMEEDGKKESTWEVLSAKSTDTNKSKGIGTSISNVASVSTAQLPDPNFITITSSMSLSQIPDGTSARTQPVTLKPSSQKDPTSAKRKATESLEKAAKSQKSLEVNKNVIASGMPRPIIVKIEPVDQVHEMPDEPPLLTPEPAATPTKPNIKVVQISNLMENPPSREISRNCTTPQNNVHYKRNAPRNIEKKSSELLVAQEEDTDENLCSDDLRELIPPFNPKRTMSDVKALIEAKRQFISAKLKTDIYEMLDEIKREYESQIELLTNVSDRYLQQFESTFETDKTKLYEDFKNKLREQMDQQITEIKRKQWCANCGAEASFHCCWNHAYCGDKCQKEDWSTHTQVCTQYNMSATDPYVRVSPRFQALLEKPNPTGAPRKISLQELIDVPVAVSLQSSPPKLQIKKTKKVIAPPYSSIPTISIPENKLPDLPKPPPSAKSFLTAPVQRLNNGEQISFDNGKHAYRIIQNPGAPKTLKVVGGAQARNQSGVSAYSGPLVRLGGQSRSFALVVGGDNSAKNMSSPPPSYGTIKKNGATPPSTSGNQAGRMPSKTVTVTRRIAPVASGSVRAPSVRLMEDNELASILSRNHLRDTYINTS